MKVRERKTKLFVNGLRGEPNESVVTAGMAVFLKGHPRSVFQNFECYLRAERIPEDDKKLVLKTSTLVFITHAILPGIYGVQDFSSPIGLFSKLPERTVPGFSVLTIGNEIGDISIKTEIYLARTTIIFEKKLSGNTILRFTP